MTHPFTVSFVVLVDSLYPMPCVRKVACMCKQVPSMPFSPVPTSCR